MSAGRWRVMTQEQFDRELRYCIAMAIVREMVSAGLLLPKEIRHIETILAKKYLPIMGPLFV
jgi:hypothetical protein